MNARFGRLRRKDVPLPTGDPLASLLEDMHDLRMTLAADLTAAAGAADAGADDVARDIIEADRVELARFARVANVRLERLGRPQPEPVKAARPEWRRRVAVALPVVPVVGAMALSAAAATGVLPIPGATRAPKPAVVRADETSPASSLQQLEKVLAGDPSASQVIAAASKLHRQLRELIATTPNDPGKAQEIANLLQLEQRLLMQKQPPGVDVVLNAAHKLAVRLVTVSEHLHTPSVAPTFVPSAPPHSHKPQRHEVSPSPSAQPTAPAPAPTTSAKPDPSPSPSDSPIALPQ